MNKYKLTLVAGAVLAFASCNPEAGNNEENDQAMVDSMVDARVEEIRMELLQRNDSIINALAMWKADSILAAKTGSKAPSRPKPNVKEAVDKPTETEKETTSSSKWKKDEGGTTSESKWNNSGEEKKEGESSKSKWGN